MRRSTRLRRRTEDSISLESEVQEPKKQTKEDVKHVVIFEENVDDSSIDSSQVESISGGNDPMDMMEIKDDQNACSQSITNENFSVESEKQKKPERKLRKKRKPKEEVIAEDNVDNISTKTEDIASTISSQVETISSDNIASDIIENLNAQNFEGANDNVIVDVKSEKKRKYERKTSKKGKKNKVISKENEDCSINESVMPIDSSCAGTLMEDNVACGNSKILGDADNEIKILDVDLSIENRCDGTKNAPTFRKAKFKIDPKKYEKMISRDISSNPLLKTSESFKKNFRFKEYFKKSNNDNNKGNKIDVFGLDNVSLNSSSENKNKFTSISVIDSDLDATNLYLNENGDISNDRNSEIVAELMKKSVLPDDLEKMEQAPKLFESEHNKKKERKKQAAETAGGGWYNLPKTEITDEVKRDLQLIKMRNVLDGKRHYKRNDSSKFPKYFQIGTVVEGAHEFYSGRVSKKKRKATMVDELLADAEFRRRNKRKFLEMQKRKMSGGKGFYRSQKNKRKPTWART